MIKSYDTFNFKMAIPDVTLTGGICKVKVTSIGKMGQEECQLAVLSCKLVSLKQQEYKVELQPDMIRLNSNGRCIKIVKQISSRRRIKRDIYIFNRSTKL